METVSVQNEDVRISVVPELGCKIISIYDMAHEHEWLWNDLNRPIRKADFGTNYLDYDISGFDECFPNIGVSQHPLDSNLTLPDHGDLWSIPWATKVEGMSISAKVEGRSFPYIFARQIRLKGRKIEFSYEVRNVSEKVFVFMWSAHPLFSVTGAMRIMINGSPRMTKEFSIGGRLGADGPDGYSGQFRSYEWPKVQDQNGTEIDLSYIGLEAPIAVKVVLNSPLDGKVTLLDLASERRLTMTLSPTEIQYLGICFNLGAVPPGDNPGTWVAIEPTSGCTDNLDDSYERGVANLLAPGETQQWTFELDLY